MRNEGVALDKAEIQGLVFSGYPKNPACGYLLLGVLQAERARAWLAALLPRLTFGEPSVYGPTQNCALSAAGLSALGLDDTSLATFPLEFREGLRQADDAFRPRILGDIGDSAPSRWLWGGPSRPTVHVMLMLYAPDEAALDAALAAERQRFAGALEEIYYRSTVDLPERKEHFGFADGISQSRFEGQAAGKTSEAPVKAGEFILGYQNEFGHMPNSPTVEKSPAAERHLAPAPAGGRADIGKNGTFVVVRQLEQDVAGFWRSMAEFSKTNGVVDRDLAVWLAAKCVGRWPSGAPLVRSPERDDPAFAKDNDFSYRGDEAGFACPIGAHIRKANPRDSLEPDAQQSVKATRRRRILRRGRAYGPGLAPFAEEPVRKERGLFFICLNTNIRRQFEFIQQSWLNNEKFSGLYEDQDPIVGDQTPGVGSTFTIPAQPLRRRLVELERFVQVHGGEYFFLPSRSALAFLSELPAQARGIAAAPRPLAAVAAG
jgi:Dyp-type peroxidase family